MSSGTGYRTIDIKDFQDPNNPDMLNAKGKWFQSRINMANGFKVLMGILILAGVLGSVFFITRYNERKKMALRDAAVLEGAAK